jgi:hypothetical protein
VDIRVVRILNQDTRIEINFTDERDLKEALVKASAFINLDDTCGCCGSKNISLQARPTKEGFTYVELVCKEQGCWAKKSFGEYKEPKGALFLKGKWEKYQKKEVQQTINENSGTA